MDKKHTLNDALDYIERWSENTEDMLSRCIEETAKAKYAKGFPYPESDKFQSVVFPSQALDRMLQSLPDLRKVTSAIRQTLKARNGHE